MMTCEVRAHNNVGNRMLCNCDAACRAELGLISSRTGYNFSLIAGLATRTRAYFFRCQLSRCVIIVISTDYSHRSCNVPYINSSGIPRVKSQNSNISVIYRATPVLEKDIILDPMPGHRRQGGQRKHGLDDNK